MQRHYQRLDRPTPTTSLFISKRDNEIFELLPKI